jgi:hypothetical protein
MARRGLVDKERDLLAAAGAPEPLVRAVAAEAGTMRWLFMMRWEGYLLAGLAGFAISVWLSATFELDGWRATLAAALIAALVGVLAVAPRLEAGAMRSHAPLRWAARRLVVLTVQTARTTDRPGVRASRDLEHLLDAAEGHDSAHAALRAVAYRLGRPDSGRGRWAGFEGHGGLPGLDRLDTNVLAVVIMVLAVCALIMAALLRFS